MTDDPLDLERIDREIRINELKERAGELAGGEMTFLRPDDDDGDPERLQIREDFWENVVQSEEGGWVSSRQQLQETGLVLPLPEELSDKQLSAKLHKLIEHLARLRTYLYSTDHLSDRELYSALVGEVLDDCVPEEIANSPTGNHIIDMLGGCSDEDTFLHYKYYADEADRASWLKEFPDFEMPPHEDPPYDRDRHLPRPPEERMSPQRKPRPHDKPVDLEKFVDEMDMQVDGLHLYYDCDTGEVVSVSDEFRDGDDDDSGGEFEDSLPDWQHEARALARAVDDDEEGVRFVALPTSFQIHEWDIMREFAEGLEDDALSKRLQDAIHGGGAFRYFKDVICEAGIQDQWFAFRKAAFLDIAREWAQWHNIPVKARTADNT